MIYTWCSFGVMIRGPGNDFRQQFPVGIFFFQEFSGLVKVDGVFLVRSLMSEMASIQ